MFPRGIAFENRVVGWEDSCGGYDVSFFDHMLAAVESNYCIDSKRVFVAGFSWGGDHATALACCRGDVIRAIAPASSTDEYANPLDYKTFNDLPCPVKGSFGIRFTHDAKGGDSAYAFPLFDTTSALYRSFNGCSATASAVSPSPCKGYESCASPYGGRVHPPRSASGGPSCSHR